MAKLGLEKTIIDQGVYENTLGRFKEASIPLPTLAQLADPKTIPEKVQRALESVDPMAAHPLNLFRVHWYNGADYRSRVDVPLYLVLPKELTGVPAPIVVAIGRTFPMIRAHKVLAAYGCLAPRIITGQFDPTRHKAVWPSTGNYCRGGVAISRIMRCRGVALLPELMSQERFDWLKEWVMEEGDIYATPGSESNVKEIYDKCDVLEDEDENNIIFNQFCEFGNHLVHYLATGKALEHIVETESQKCGGLTPRAFVSATGSAGTIAAGDYLKERYGTLTVAVEALECPTLLYNGFGEHNIQGIGDKHIPFIHNTLLTDVVTAVPERASDRLSVLFNHPEGQRYLKERRGLAADLVDKLPWLGLSSICNVLAAIKTARYFDYGPDDAVLTVATDGADLYESENAKALKNYYQGNFDAIAAGETFGEHLSGMATDHLLELSTRDRDRIFNLGYYTWVEQQGMSLEEFTQRRQQSFWRDLRGLIPAWDALIDEFNQRTGALDAL
ncbi:MAG: pyridoxal-5'-phosphate-dependent protein subunit beta [Deltaproteobacteria bacterium]|nr:pyridoxal-5'-phosphate-dependent protein subunit beta [Deltaproteobacteria bacterium]